MSVYVPVLDTEKIPYLEDLKKHLPRHLVGKEYFIAGDWNCVMVPAIDSTNPTGENKGQKQLAELIERGEWVDAYRHLNPKKFCTTNFNYRANRRLDHIYVSQSMAGHISGVRHWEKGRSTHLPVVMSWIIPDSLRIGPSWFKCPADLFEDEEATAGILGLVRTLWKLSLIHI